MADELRAALALGDPQRVRELLDAGADIHYQVEHGYDALIDAVHGRDVLRDPRLMELLTLLVDSGVSVRGMSTYGESGVRVLSRLGRFDAVQFLLRAGANPDDLQFTDLIRAVAFGTLADVEAVIAQGADLEATDHWERTAWLVAVQTGDIPKARLVLERGARRDVSGRCGKPPLFHAIESHHAPMLEWLLGLGMDVHQTDDFGRSALRTAAQYDDLGAVRILLRAGADVNRQSSDALGGASTREVAIKLLEAGSDPNELTSGGRRAILGYPPNSDADLLRISVDEFRNNRLRRFGTRNPEVMTNLFWEGMIRSGLSAYRAEKFVEGDRDFQARPGPVWCAQRFGQSLTFLPDGRIVQVAGEHEDHYDPDFCIYNDVFVHDPGGRITIYGYPESVFPPTDFHTATLIGDHVYLIGSLGYQGSRKFGQTPVYRLDVNTARLEALQTTGDNPGWIYKHRATLTASGEIQVSGGTLATDADGVEVHTGNTGTFTLNVGSLIWQRNRRRGTSAS